MFCKHCGTKITDNARFCASCGQPVGVEGKAAAIPAAERRRHRSLLWLVPVLLVVAAGAWLGGYLHWRAATKRAPVPAPIPRATAPAEDDVAMPDQLLASGNPGANIACNTPAWSPDGRKIAYVKRPLNYTGEKEKVDLYLAEYGGGTSWKHRQLGKQADYPVWSPDGAQLAFNQGALCVMDMKSGKVRQLVKDNLTDDDTIEINYPLSWSADGRYLLYEVAYWEGGEIDLYDFHTGKIVPIEFAQAAWMPDGRLFLSADGDMYEDGDEYLAIFDPKTKEIQKLGVKGYGSALIVPDKNNAYLYDGETLLHFDMKSHRLSKLQSLAADELAWNPDGKRFAYITEASRVYGQKESISLYIGQLGSQQSRLIASKVMPDSANWHDRMRMFAWSADGSRLAYATETGNIMIVTP